MAADFLPHDSGASRRIAVLFDCDNISARNAGAVLEELAAYGTPTIKRAYGDWTTAQLSGWKHELNRQAIQPVQQFSYTTGKNSTDSALIIDAMDLLWQGNVEAFALVSSDSDFTRLATRLRESGKRVYGFGMRKTPESLRKAVDQFIYLELLQDESAKGSESDTTAATGKNGHQGADSTPGRLNLRKALTRAIDTVSDDEGWASLSRVGQHLSRAHTDFDPRDFGATKLSTLVKEQTYLTTASHDGVVRVRLNRQ